jgi:hypothetical protein
MVKLRVLRIEISNQLQYIRWWKILFCNELYMVRIDISEALKFHVEKEEMEFIESQRRALDKFYRSKCLFLVSTAFKI